MKAQRPEFRFPGTSLKSLNPGALSSVTWALEGGPAAHWPASLANQWARFGEREGGKRMTGSRAGKLVTVTTQAGLWPPMQPYQRHTRATGHSFLPNASFTFSSTPTVYLFKHSKQFPQTKFLLLFSFLLTLSHTLFNFQLHWKPSVQWKTSVWWPSELLCTPKTSFKDLALIILEEKENKQTNKQTPSKHSHKALASIIYNSNSTPITPHCAVYSN